MTTVDDRLERQMTGARRWAREVRESFVEDVDWIAADHADVEAAATRLGIQPETLKTRLKRYGREDILDRLAPGRVPDGPRVFVDGAPVRAHIRKLQELGWTNAAMADAAGTSERTINRIVAGQGRVRERIARPLLAVQSPPAAPRVPLRDWLHPRHLGRR